MLSDALKKASWEEHRHRFGIRNVYHLSASRDGLDQHIESIRKKHKEIEAKKNMFVVTPVDPEKESKQRKKLEQELDRLHAFVSDRPGTTYTIVLQLTEEKVAHGGHIAVKILDHKHPDEDEQFALSFEEATEHDVPDKSVAKALFRQVEDMRLEKGSAFVIPSTNSFGFEPVHYGSKSLLVVEFWQYRDSKISSNLVSLEEGEKLGFIEDHTKHEL